MEVDDYYEPNYKRAKYSHMTPNFGISQNMAHLPCNCPPPRKGLPQDQSSAAWDGRVEDVRTWLKDGGNINAVNQYGGTLLSAACCNGQVEMMRELLSHPEIHLNMSHGGKTALAQAIQYNHVECVGMILTSGLKCRPLLAGQWSTIIDILRQHPIMSHESARYILLSAVNDNEWAAVEIMLALSNLYTIEDLDPILQKAFALNEWEIVCSVLRRKFRHKAECMNELFAKLIERRDWEKVDTILKLEKKYAKFDIRLAEACLEENEVKAHQLLKQTKGDTETLNGTFLVVAAGGTSEEVCHLLLDCYHLFSDETILNAIYLSAMKNNLEILPHLLQKHFPRLSYNALGIAQNAAERFGNKNAVKLLDKALEAKAQNLFRG